MLFAHLLSPCEGHPGCVEARWFVRPPPPHLGAQTSQLSSSSRDWGWGWGGDGVVPDVGRPLPTDLPRPLSGAANGSCGCGRTNGPEAHGDPRLSSTLGKNDESPAPPEPHDHPHPPRSWQNSSASIMVTGAARATDLVETAFDGNAHDVFHGVLISRRVQRRGRRSPFWAATALGEVAPPSAIVKWRILRKKRRNRQPNHVSSRVSTVAVPLQARKLRVERRPFCKLLPAPGSLAH